MIKIKVLVVEDQAVVREGVVAILSFSPDIEVVGQAENGVQALTMVKSKKPDVILLDLVMPQMDGLTAIPQLKKSILMQKSSCSPALQKATEFTRRLNPALWGIC